MKKLGYLIIILLIALSFEGWAQGQPEPIYFSGFIVEAENAEPMPGVHLYIPKAGRGSTTNLDGFFALPTFPGDSIVISYIGYKKLITEFPRINRKATQ
ncbi:MAG: carboxypeptidase-like regulatory domain-containing protein [Bacteroidia bacterium]|nr:carboxypeptidase-like regulatory domain-containing protein [Bacteroidia bacterium]